MKTPLLLCACMALPLLSFDSQARSETLLESFEDGIENVRPSTEGRGAAGNVQLTLVSKTDANEPYITQGTNALKVELLNDQMWWGVDFFITLDAEAAEKLAAAWDGNVDTDEKPLARYVLAYDLTFPAAGVVQWMNQAVNNHWEASREWNTPGNDTEPVKVEIELDLAAGILTRNEDGTADLRFIDNAQWTEGIGSIPTMYIDNIRLIDQWASETPPTVTVIESFEDGIAAATPSVPEGGRTTLASYTTTGEGDDKVTHGTKALEISIGQPEGWADDVKIDLSANEQLKEILALPAEERERYILRIDMRFQDTPEGGWGGGNWGYKFGTSLNLADTARTPSSASTFSVNLARADLDPEAPIITLYGNGGYGDVVVTHVDNIRIVDTGGGTTGGGGLRITGVTHNAQQDQITITWEAEAGATYRVVASTDLRTWNTTLADNHPTGGATGTSASLTVPVNETEKARFFQVTRIQ